MWISIPFGEKNAEIEIPKENLLGVFRLQKEVKELKESEIINALRSPIGSPSLKELAKSSKNAVIVVSDKTRPVPNKRILPYIIDELNRGGLTKENIKIVIALGLHEKMTKKEIMEHLGEENIERVSEVLQHDPDSHCKYVGTTTYGNDIEVNEDVCNADLVILIGGIVPHFFSGYAGGMKSILPGVTSRGTIFRNHIKVIEFTPRPSVGDIDNNPVRKEMDEIVEMMNNKLFIVNVLLDPKKRLVDIVAGHPIEAFRKGVENAEEIYCIKVPEKVDIAIFGAYPLDMNLYQGSKAVINCLPAVKPDGEIILVTPLTEYAGTGEPSTYEEKSFVKLMKLSKEEIVKIIKEKSKEVNPIAGIIAYLDKEVLEKYLVRIVTKYPKKSLLKEMGFIVENSLQEAIDKLLKEKKDAKIAVFPNAPECYVKIQDNYYLSHFL